MKLKQAILFLMVLIFFSASVLAATINVNVAPDQEVIRVGDDFHFVVTLSSPDSAMINVQLAGATLNFRESSSLFGFTAWDTLAEGTNSAANNWIFNPLNLNGLISGVWVMDGSSHIPIILPPFRAQLGLIKATAAAEGTLVPAEFSLSSSKFVERSTMSGDILHTLRTVNFESFTVYPETYCVADVDCTSGEHCVANRCESGEVGSPCVDGEDSTCDAGLFCVDSICSDGSDGDSCIDEEDCAEDLFCAAGFCDGGGVGDACDADADCLAGNRCTDGICEADTDGDGIVDSLDVCAGTTVREGYTLFTSGGAVGCIMGDIDLDGDIDTLDINRFNWYYNHRDSYQGSSIYAPANLNYEDGNLDFNSLDVNRFNYYYNHRP